MKQIAKRPNHLPYKFMARVKFITKSTRSKLTGNLVTSRCVILIPDYVNSSSARRFLAAWLPDTDEPRKYFELGVFIGHPVFAPCRVAIFRKNDDSPEEHYLFCMSLSAEHDLMSDDMNGRMVEVESMPSNTCEETLYNLEEGRVPEPDLTILR